ncbi:MAG: methylmalonyl-CoA mutase family protein, partial [Candidatus Marinimicrobia bacterium]|nr:methylmalonyl-CoA mutase family protein [Candidatus Neomarinimicrobiota bacterium]
MQDKFSKAQEKWVKDAENSKSRDYSYKSASGEEVDLLYYPDSDEHNYSEQLNFPGQYPYTRGIHPNLYRGKLWTMRQFAGFGTPFETNQRFQYLLSQGQTGLSVAFDMPTLMGYDADHPLADGEVGVCGVAVSSLRDMEVLFNGIDLSKISVSMTINGPAVIIFAFYVAVAQKQGLDISQLNGTLQNDILKEFIAQKEWIYPPNESMRIIMD